MTAARDLLHVAMDTADHGPVERGDLSLALAGAEMIDLLGAEAAGLEDDRVVPGHRPTGADPLLEEAAASLVRETPQESVGDWLWRRGRNLSAAYTNALEEEGQFTRRRHRGRPFQTGELVPVDTPAHREAVERWTSGEPVLDALTAALGIRGKETAASPDVENDAVATVLAAVNDALLELEAYKQRRAVEQAAFDNIWRGDW
ncbi:GPP34 family phosphoprotein [Streptomyces pathocidini]|uniref:GPP34 family phosphoprotein n=1 Tax=Streptomyces pathocidini TaxID=1650571 RepID=A0ABW7UQ63_9ACTN|nr:GPP34 family phosphoprotein [Streptomyces pathocidini]